MCDISLKMPSDLCLRLCGLCAFLWLFTVTVQAQTVTLQGKVSETVALSVSPNSIHDQAQVSVVNNGSSVRMTLSGTGSNPAVIRVPLTVRSNTSFKISGMFESTMAQLDQLSVTDVRATGMLVSTEAVNNLEKSELSDLGHGPFFILSGPRVSTGGTLNSLTNALEITLLLRIKPQSSGNWLAQLTFLNN